MKFIVAVDYLSQIADNQNRKSIPLKTGKATFSKNTISSKYAFDALILALIYHESRRAVNLRVVSALALISHRGN